MNRTKRVTVATFSGILFGIVCYGMASSAPGELPAPVAYQIIASRALIGVAIGISAVKAGHWSVHGLLMGLLFSLPLAFGGMMAPGASEFSKIGMFVWTIVLGMIYGLLIEAITTKIFKAGAHTARMADHP